MDPTDPTDPTNSTGPTGPKDSTDHKHGDSDHDDPVLRCLGCAGHFHSTCVSERVFEVSTKGKGRGKAKAKPAPDTNGSVGSTGASAGAGADVSTSIGTGTSTSTSTNGLSHGNGDAHGRVNATGGPSGRRRRELLWGDDAYHFICKDCYTPPRPKPKPPFKASLAKALARTGESTITVEQVR